MASGTFSLAFSTAFEVYSGVLPSGVISPPLLREYILDKKRGSLYHGFFVTYGD